LAEAGAKDVTAAEIRSGLRLPSTEEQTRSLFVKLLPTLKGDGEFSLSTANKIYVRQNFSIKDEFKQVATSVYLADLENLDFSKSDEAASAVNKWVKEQTGHKIKNLLKPGDVDGSTVVILVNALYFKGAWRRQFPKFATAKRKFHTTSAEVMDVESMHEHGAYHNYWESSEVNAKFLELPFKGDDVSMVLILPNEREGVGALESQIEKVLETPHFTKEFVEVVLPKFKIESQIGFKTDFGKRK
jgi:serpin B